MPSEKEFKVLLDQLEDFHYFHYYEIFDQLTDAIKGTELVKFLPDLLNKLRKKDSSDGYDYEDNYEFLYIAFYHLINIAKESNLMSEHFSEFSRTIQVFGSCDESKYPNVRSFYDLFNAIKGTELLRTKFLDLLNLADNLPPGYGNQNNYEAFSKLIDEIKGTALMRGNLSDLLKGLENTCDAFYALINVIKGTELMKEKIMDVLDLLDEIIDKKYDKFSGEKYYAFAKLIDALKETGSINEYYTLLEKPFSILLNGLKEEYNFSILIKSIKGTDLINKYFRDLLDILDRFSAGEICYAFSKLISQIKDTELFLKEYDLIEIKFSLLLNRPDRMSTKSLSTLLSSINGTDLVNKFYLETKKIDIKKCSNCEFLYFTTEFDKCSKLNIKLNNNFIHKTYCNYFRLNWLR